MTLDELKVDIDAYCRKNLPEKLEKVPTSKVIHDTTWGTNRFKTYEISIINTPLFQRLRLVTQMGFANYVYPSARHSRFEHSLGVTILVEKMCKHINTDSEEISDNDIVALRLAGLLHDIGHCLFSHTSELVYSSLLENFIEEEFDDLAAVASHEFLGYLIVTSKSFNTYFSLLMERDKFKVDLQEIALMIVGRTIDERKRYLTSFINGPFDADKIDYFSRDSHFSGIPAQIDLDRLFYEIKKSDISKFAKEGSIVNDLTIGISGVTCVEQIIFNKMFLYSSIYNHQKVESLDCMFKGVFEYIIDKKIEVKVFDKVLDFKNPVSFLYFTEYDFYSLSNSTKDEKLRQLIRNIIDRKLLKRSVTINKNTVESGVLGLASNIFSTDANRLEKEKELRSLVKIIHKEAGVDCEVSEIWIDIPKAPTLKEGSMPYVRVNKNSHKEFGKISDFFPFSQFQELYTQNKRSCYVFGPEKYLNEIAAAAKKIFSREYHIELKDTAFKYGCNSDEYSSTLNDISAVTANSINTSLLRS